MAVNNPFSTTLKDKINSRYKPAETPRSIKTDGSSHKTKLASEVNFQPVSQVTLGNGKIYVRAVNNRETRPVSTAAVGKDGKVAIRGQRVIDLGPNLHQEIQTKAKPKLEPKPNSTGSKTPIPTKIKTETLTAEQAKYRSKELREQLEAINQELYQHLKVKIAEEIKAQTKAKPASTPAPSPPAIKKPEVAPVPKPSLPTVVQAKPAVQPPTTQAVTSQQPVPEAPKVAVVEPVKPVILPPVQLGKQTDHHHLHQGKLAPTTPIVAKVTIVSQPQPPAQAVPKPSPVTTNQTPVGPRVETKVTEAAPKPVQANDPELEGHISRLEGEISALTKEISQLDQAFVKLEQERRAENLSVVNQQLDYDKKVMEAVVAWRGSLTDLVNSHTIALKYLKDKTDWLDTQVNKLEGHHGRVSKGHHKPKELTFQIEPPIPPVAQPPSLPSSSAVTVSPTQAWETSATPKIEPKSAEPPVTTTPEPVNKPQPEPITEIKAAEQPAELSQAQKEEMQKLVSTEVAKKEAELAKSQPAGKPVVVNVSSSALPASANVTPVADLTPNLQQDIEKQILDMAAREESAKENVREAKEEAAAKAKAEAEKAKEPPKPVQATISPESIKSLLTQVKADLTKTGTPSLDKLSTAERTTMMQDLQRLENQSEVSRQFDEIKAAGERRKVNTELQAMLSKLENKPTAPPATATAQPSPGQATGAPVNPGQKVEQLKVEQRKQKTPEEKAKIIAEIKELERQREAIKAAERARPTVKAQPAYGKMLPNTPTIPNVINGIVKDNRGLLLDTVVIIVKDQNGEPVRAFKTNKIGQFALSTPVPNGVYNLELEKSGYDFDIIEVDVAGGILPPIEIKAR